MRHITAAAVALAAALWFVVHIVFRPYYLAADFSWPWAAARLLLEGRSPYGVALFPAIPLFGDPFFYPLPAALVALPLAPLPAMWAGAIWAGGSAALLALMLPRHLWPVLLSAPLWQAAYAGQWAPILAAGLLWAPASVLWVCKPSLGVALFLARPRWQAIVGGGALCLVGLALLPSWPLEWLGALRRSHHPIPLLTPAGLVLGPLLAALVWRRGLGDWRVRLLFGLCLVPQMVRVYDMLPALMVARTRREALILALASWAAHFVSYPLTDTAPELAAPALFLLGYALPILRLHLIDADERRPRRSGADRTGAARISARPPHLIGPRAG